LIKCLIIAIIVSEIKKREIKMSNKIEVAIVIELSAGVGTGCSDVHTLEVPEKLLLEYSAGNKDGFNNYVDSELDTWGMAVDHAQSYGIEQGDEGFYEDGGEEGDAEEPYSVVRGIYIPEVHDRHCCTGHVQTCLDTPDVQKAYDNYEAFKKTL
jgi:hypothetical protein